MVDLVGNLTLCPKSCHIVMSIPIDGIRPMTGLFSKIYVWEREIPVSHTNQQEKNECHRKIHLVTVTNGD